MINFTLNQCKIDVRVMAEFQAVQSILHVRVFDSSETPINQGRIIWEYRNLVLWWFTRMIGLDAVLDSVLLLWGDTIATATIIKENTWGLLTV